MYQMIRSKVCSLVRSLPEFDDTLFYTCTISSCCSSVVVDGPSGGVVRVIRLTLKVFINLSSSNLKNSASR